MKRAYSKSSYAKPCERYCREQYPDEAERIFASAEEYYLGFMKDMPDLGENMMAKNMLDWFTIIAFMRRAGTAWTARCWVGTAATTGTLATRAQC